MSCVDSIVKALQEHQNQQSSEREKLYKHRKKCYDAPNKYLGMIIDGMDQKKTLLPHFVHTPKNLQEENLFSFTWLVVWFSMKKCVQGFTSQLQIFIMIKI
jgi:hypothetical protein